MHWVFKSKNPHGNVVFNFSHNAIEDLAHFAKGYHRAGKHLAEKLAASRGYADFDGYPILFLYRHALEALYESYCISRSSAITNARYGNARYIKTFQTASPLIASSRY